MKKYINQIGKWLAAAVVAITIIQANALPANAEIIGPGGTFEGPLVPQFSIKAVNCKYPAAGEYSFEIFSSGMKRPLTTPNFLPCGNPRAIDSYYPPGTVGKDKVIIKNLGTVDINVEPIPD